MLFKRKGIAGILEKIEKGFTSVLFFPRLALSEGLSDTIRKQKIPIREKVLILANGPSLKAELEEIKSRTDKLQDADYIGVNDFAMSPDYCKLRPKHYVISDSKYFMKTIYEERSLNTLKQMNNRTTWEMNLFVPYKWRKTIYNFHKIDNPKIHIVPFHSVRFWGLDSIRMYAYKWGLGNGEFGTVVLNAIYIALVLGYKNNYLFGVDHTFFDGLYVNKENQLCYIYRHFDDTQADVRPMISHHMGDTKPFTMQDFLVEKLDVWNGHVIMNNFAKFMKADIINFTQNSMIDTYKRGSIKEL